MKSTKKDIAILMLSALLVWAWICVADLERQRYTYFLGLCGGTHDLPAQHKCIRDANPRTNNIWNLAYGLGLIRPRL